MLVFNPIPTYSALIGVESVSQKLLRCSSYVVTEETLWSGHYLCLLPWLLVIVHGTSFFGIEWKPHDTLFNYRGGCPALTKAKYGPPTRKRPVCLTLATDFAWLFEILSQLQRYNILINNNSIWFEEQYYKAYMMNAKHFVCIISFLSP
jgi:hypothetical protein